MATIATLSAVVTARAEKFDRAMDRVERRAKTTQRIVNRALNFKLGSLKNVVRLTGVVLASGFIAMSAGAAKATAAASDLNEQLNLEQLVFKELTGQMREWAEVTADATGRSANEVAAMATEFQAVLGPMMGARDAAMEFSKGLAQLAIDVSSARNIPEKLALEKLRAGIVGEIEPLRQLGVVMTQANLNAFALGQGILKTVKQMSEAEKVALRYKFITQGLSDIQGDAANTAEEFANRQRALSSIVSRDLVPILGQEMLPVANEFIGILLELAKETRSNEDAMRSWVRKGVGAIVDTIPFAIGVVAFFGKALMGLKVVGNLAVAGLIEAFRRILIEPLEFVRKFTEEMNALFTTMGKSIRESGIPGAAKLAEPFSKLGGVFLDLESKVKKAQKSAEGLAAKTADARDVFIDTALEGVEAFEKIGLWQEKARKFAERLWDAFRKGRKATDDAAEGVERVARVVARAAGDAGVLLHRLQGVGKVGAGMAAEQVVGGSMLSSIAEGAAQGAAVGGPAGGIAGGIAALLAESEQFGEMLEMLNSVLQVLANTVGKLIEPFLPLQALASKLVAIWASLTSSMGIFKLVMEVLTGIMKGLFEAIRFVAISILKVAKWIADRFGGNSKINKALEALRNATWDNITAQEDLADAAKAAASGLFNVPQGFKIALERFRATIAGASAPNSNIGTGTSGPITSSGSALSSGSGALSSDDDGVIVIRIRRGDSRRITQEVIEALRRVGVLENGGPLGSRLPFATVTGRG